MQPCGLIRPPRTDRHEIGRAALAFARLNERANSARASTCRRVAPARLDPRIPGLGIDHHTFAVNDVLSLAYDDIAAERNCFVLQVVNAEIAACALGFVRDGHRASGFDPSLILPALLLAE